MQVPYTERKNYSVDMYLRYALFWDVTQCRVVIVCAELPLYAA
jgi:hypothetical protein